jgi:hypothetical protein
LGLTGSGGRSGSITAQSASETSGLAMPNQLAHRGFVRCYKRLFGKGLSGGIGRDSSSGCGHPRAVAGWPRLRRRPSAIPLI